MKIVIEDEFKCIAIIWGKLMTPMQFLLLTEALSGRAGSENKVVN